MIQNSAQLLFFGGVLFSFCTFAENAVVAQEDASAFIDPFNPLKKNQTQESEVTKNANSVFPKLSVPKLPKMPKLPNLNPFSKKKSSSGIMQSGTKPNMFQQLGTGTKNFFSKTTQTLMPWTKPKPSIPKGAIIPAFMQNERTAEKKKSGIQLMNFFGPSTSDKRVETTSDFFRQERPGFRK